MILSVYLHKYVVDTLRMFGELSYVVNKILQAGADGKIDLLDKPACVNRNGAGRYDIEINQTDYLELLQCYSINSPKISIRRILYWFVDFSIYEELGWKPTEKYCDKDLQSLCKCIDKARSAIGRIAVKRINDEATLRRVINIDNLLVELKEYLKNG